MKACTDTWRAFMRPMGQCGTTNGECNVPLGRTVISQPQTAKFGGCSTAQLMWPLEHRAGGLRIIGGPHISDA